MKGVFVDQGEVCLAGTRLLVQRPVYDEFVARFVEGAEQWQPSNPLEESSRMGPLVSTEHLDKVLGYVDIAQEEGAKLLTGGHRLTDGDLAQGNYMAPTVFADADNTMRCMREEIFGPVQTIMPFDTEDEAIAIANDSDYGLAGMVWTTNLNTAHRVGPRGAHRARCGSTASSSATCACPSAATRAPAWGARAATGRTSSSRRPRPS